MKISEAAAETGLSADTIRFYEKSGVLGPLTRGQDGHRVFTAKDLRWLRMFERLRSTDMPLTEVKFYADLARKGDSTFAERKALLEKHRARIEDQQKRINDCRALIDAKIEMYGQPTVLPTPT